LGGQKKWNKRMWLNDRIRNIIARHRFNRTYGRHLGVLSVTDEELAFGRYRLQDTTTILENDWSLPWSKIRKIQAYKRDCHITDLICLDIETDGGRQFEVNEEMDGWREMQGALAARFGIQEDAWFAEVAVPAFETNQKTLWTREGEE